MSDFDTSGNFDTEYTDDLVLTSPVIYLEDGGYLMSWDNTSVVNSLYATKSGVVVFTKYKQGEPIVPKPLSKPSAKT